MVGLGKETMALIRGVMKFRDGETETIRDSIDYAVLGASSKLSAILLTYPFQVIRARLQQHQSIEGIPRYMDSWHVVKETARYEGLRGFYRGIAENVLNILKLRKDL